MRSIRLQVQEIHLNWQITEVNFNCRDELLRYWAISPFPEVSLEDRPFRGRHS